MWHKIRESDIKFSPSANRSEELEGMINWMMVSDATERPCINELIQHHRILNNIELKLRPHNAIRDITNSN